MALTGELSDLSLAELIEFFCNQRKTGRLKVVYSNGPGYFYLQAGSVVHARVGDLRGIEAVYFALTLPNASFTFSPAFDAPEQTIHQPWASLVLEGLRRMDEGVAPRNPFPVARAEDEFEKDDDAVEAAVTEQVAVATVVEEPAPVTETVKETVKEKPVEPEPKPVPRSKPNKTFVPEFASDYQQSGRSWTLRAVVGAVVLLIAVVGVPWGWYARNKAARLANDSKPAIEATQPVAAPVDPAAETASAAMAPESEQQTTGTDASDLAAKHLREARARERAKLQEAAASMSSQTASTTDAANPAAPRTQPPTSSSPTTGAKRVTVLVTYDENGRVTQASGADPTALRIARQKRFPAGKAGSATITIPIN